MSCNEEMQSVDDIYNYLRGQLPLLNALFNDSSARSSSRVMNSNVPYLSVFGLEEEDEEEEEDDEDEDGGV